VIHSAIDYITLHWSYL